MCLGGPGLLNRHQDPRPLQPGRGSCVSPTPHTRRGTSQGHRQASANPKPNDGHATTRATRHRNTRPAHAARTQTWHAADAHTRTAPPSSHTPAPAYAPLTTASANSDEATQPLEGTTATTGPPGRRPPASSRPARPHVGAVASPSRQANRSILVMTMKIVRSFADQNIVFAIEAPQAKRHTNTTEPKRTDTYTPQGVAPTGAPSDRR